MTTTTVSVPILMVVGNANVPQDGNLLKLDLLHLVLELMMARPVLTLTNALLVLLNVIQMQPLLTMPEVIHALAMTDSLVTERLALIIMNVIDRE